MHRQKQHTRDTVLLQTTPGSTPKSSPLVHALSEAVLGINVTATPTYTRSLTETWQTQGLTGQVKLKAQITLGSLHLFNSYTSNIYNVVLDLKVNQGKTWGQLCSKPFWAQTSNQQLTGATGMLFPHLSFFYKREDIFWSTGQGTIKLKS